MTVQQLLHSLTSREIGEWYAFFRLETEDRKRAELDAKARSGLSSARSRRRR
jgi:hypothetical protein